MSKITEKTTVPLGLLFTILTVVVTGVAGGAVWVTSMTWQVTQLRQDMQLVKARLGIAANREPADTASFSLIPEARAAR